MTTSDLVDRLLYSLSESAPSGLAGSQLGTLVRIVDQFFSPADHGYSTLKDFLLGEVPGLIVLGRQGADLRYGLRDWDTAPTDSGLRPDVSGSVNLWQVWVSPYAPFRVAVDRTHGTLRALGRVASVAADEVVVEPTPVELHISIANEFVAEHVLDSSLRERLREISGSGDQQWWREWSKLLEVEDPQVFTEWWRYREARLHKALVERLEGLLHDPTAVSAALSCFESERRKRKRKNVDREPATKNSRVDSRLRHIVRNVVDRLGEDDLRELRLPVGLVIDATQEESG